MAGGKLENGVFKTGGANSPGWMNNIAIVRATTTNAGDSIKITSADGTALTTSNPGWITLPSTVTAGQLVTFQVTADVTILLTGMSFGYDTFGDVTGALLRVLAINDNGTCRWGVALLGGRTTLYTSDVYNTQVGISEPTYVFCDGFSSSTDNLCVEIGYVRANFDDTGGAAENLWAIQTGQGDVMTGQISDGIFQPMQIAEFVSGWASVSASRAVWCQIGRLIYIKILTLSGTSDSTATSIYVPACSRISLKMSNPGRVIDNGTTLQVPTAIAIGQGLRGLSFFTDLDTGAWTASGTKTISTFFNYEVGPAASFIE